MAQHPKKKFWAAVAPLLALSAAGCWGGDSNRTAVACTEQCLSMLAMPYVRRHRCRHYQPQVESLTIHRRFRQPGGAS